MYLYNTHTYVSPGGEVDASSPRLILTKVARSGQTRPRESPRLVSAFRTGNKSRESVGRGRELEDRIGREVTTRTLYILGTFTIRISPGGCCHVPLGHVPGVRPKGLRASSRVSHLPSFAAISPLFPRPLSRPLPPPRRPLPFSRDALSARQIPQKKNGGDGSARHPRCSRTVHGSRERKGSSSLCTPCVLPPPPPSPSTGSSHVSSQRGVAYREASKSVPGGRTRACSALLPSDSRTAAARNVGLTTKPRLTTERAR